MAFNCNLDTASSAAKLSGTGGNLLKRFTRGVMALAASGLMVGSIGYGAIAAEAIETSSTKLASHLNTSSSVLKAAAKERTGSFRAVDHPTTGSVTVVEDAESPYLTLSSDFKTDSGPTLEIILYSQSSVPVSIEGKAPYYRLAKLRKVQGSDRYALPKDLDLSKYQSVGIWCERFDVTFGYAPLQ